MLLIVTIFSFLGAALVQGSKASSMMDMHMDMHAHHRCCFHDVWNGMMYQTDIILKNGSMTPEAFESMIHLDSDFSMKMQRLNITSHDIMSGTHTHMIQWKDYHTRITYTMMMDGKCSAAHMDPMDMMHTPCIPGGHMYVGHMTLGSGMDSLHIHNWMGMDPEENGLQTTIGVSESDCTPVTMGIQGELKGTMMKTDILFADVTQGMLSSMDAFNIPMLCTHMDVMPSFGR